MGRNTDSQEERGNHKLRSGSGTRRRCKWEEWTRWRGGVKRSKTASTDREETRGRSQDHGCCFCRLVHSPTPKYTITSHRAWETSPNQHTASKCLAYLCSYWRQRYIPHCRSIALARHSSLFSVFFAERRLIHAVRTRWSRVQKLLWWRRRINLHAFAVHFVRIAANTVPGSPTSRSHGMMMLSCCICSFAVQLSPSLPLSVCCRRCSFTRCFYLLCCH